MYIGIHAESLEERDDNEDDGPCRSVSGRDTALTAMVEGEREMNKHFRSKSFVRVRVDDIVDLGNARRDQETEHECGDVPSFDPEENVDTVKCAEEREPAANCVNHKCLAGSSELVEDHAEEEEMDEAPDPERVVWRQWTSGWAAHSWELRRFPAS